MLVLAGGFGTRLQSAVSDVPKPLAPISGIPFLRFQIENWVNQGINSFVFLLHHKADLIIKFLEAEMNNGLKNCEVQWVIEDSPMGTGGSIKNAISQIKITDEFLVSNADTWLSGGIELIEKVKGACIAVTNVENIERYGSVEVSNGKVVNFLEKGDKIGEGLINAGLCKLSPAVFLNHNENLPFSLEQIIFPQLVLEGKLNSVLLSGDFIDIGIPIDYYKFCDLANKNYNL